MTRMLQAENAQACISRMLLKGMHYYFMITGFAFIFLTKSRKEASSSCNCSQWLHQGTQVDEVALCKLGQLFCSHCIIPDMKSSIMLQQTPGSFQLASGRCQAKEYSSQQVDATMSHHAGMIVAALWADVTP